MGVQVSGGGGVMLEDLKQTLCSLNGLKDNSSLHRALKKGIHWRRIQFDQSDQFGFLLGFSRRRHWQVRGPQVAGDGGGWADR